MEVLTIVFKLIMAFPTSWYIPTGKPMVLCPSGSLDYKIVAAHGLNIPSFRANCNIRLLISKSVSLHYELICVCELMGLSRVITGSLAGLTQGLSCQFLSDGNMQYSSKLFARSSSRPVSGILSTGKNQLTEGFPLTRPTIFKLN
jgi:hypothetical protein